MKKLILISLFCILHFAFCIAQNNPDIKRTWHWYFGDKAGIDFSGGNAVAVLDGQLQTFEGSSTISDTSGNLLFYTNGITVWNSVHDTMINGDGLLGAESASQTAIFIPKPGDPNIYYLFTVGSFFKKNPYSCYYHIIDKTLDNGKGAITSKNNLLYNNYVSEKLTAIKDYNGIDWWVLFHDWYNNGSNFLAYHVTDNGVDTVPIISQVGHVLDWYSSLGNIKASINGNKIAMTTGGGYNDFQIFDFNNLTGIVSNPITIHVNSYDSLLYGLTFSPNTTKLYVTKGANDISPPDPLSRGEIYQYDLMAGTALDIEQSKTIIYSDSLVSYGGIVLGPDGKIYIGYANLFITNESEWLDVIKYPENPAASCDFIRNDFYLGGRTNRFGMPNICDGLLTNLITGTSNNQNLGDENEIKFIVAEESWFIFLKEFSTKKISLKFFTVIGQLVKSIDVNCSEQNINISFDNINNWLLILQISSGNSSITSKVILNQKTINIKVKKQ